MKFIGKSKSILATILSVAILITSSSVAFAQGSSTIANTVTPQSDILPKTMTLGNFKIDTLVNTKEKQKIKFTDLKTGKEEYLETSLENGKYVYLSTSEVGVNKVESGADVITITDQKTKEVKVISKKDVTASEITTQSWPRYGTPIYLYGVYWFYDHTTYSSISTQYAQISLVASVIAAVLCGPVGSITLAFALYCVGEQINNLWYMRIYDEGSFNSDGSDYQQLWLHQTYFYTDSARTNFVKFETYDNWTCQTH